MDVPEISDVVVAYDLESLERQPVPRDDALGALMRHGQRKAARVLRAIPHDEEGHFNPREVDELLLRAHRELQRLNEEFQQPQRILELLRPTVKLLQVRGVSPVRVVDVGCGLGYVMRWFAAKGSFGPDVELIGCDFNRALVDEANRLRTVESLDCQFRVANAFALAEPAHIYLSTGVLHHFRDEGLRAFFRGQTEGPHTEAFFHFDVEPSWLAPLGAWLFHRARMREPLAQNDGVRSALRAHTTDTLIDAARHDDFRVGVFRVGSKILPITRTLRPVVGIRRGTFGAWTEALGRSARLLRHMTP